MTCRLSSSIASLWEPFQPPTPLSKDSHKLFLWAPTGACARAGRHTRARCPCSPRPPRSPLSRRLADRGRDRRPHLPGSGGPLVPDTQHAPSEGPASRSVDPGVHHGRTPRLCISHFWLCPPRPVCWCRPLSWSFLSDSHARSPSFLLSPLIQPLLLSFSACGAGVRNFLLCSRSFPFF